MAKRKILYKEVVLPEWTPFIRAKDDPQLPGVEIWFNSRYQVRLFRYSDQTHMHPDMYQLSIKWRIAHPTPDISYQEKMRIRDALLGPNIDMLERYPARDEEIDIADWYHLWGYADEAHRWPIGLHPQKK